MKKKTLAFHFVSNTLRDGRPVPADGVWLEHTGHISMCSSGLHFSRDAFDALQYAPGATLCLVEVEDIVSEDKDKGVCRRRKIVARFDATDILRYFARMQALSVLDAWQTNPADVVLEWLMTGDESARSAAWSAARSAARSAAWSAAESAAWSAARSAAWSAAVSAADMNALSAFNHPAQAKLAAIWLPMENAFRNGLWLYWITPTIAICVEQPSLSIENDRLHRADGPAVEWPAGERYWFWRGTEVPQSWIDDRASLDAKTALTWPNLEQRRIACAEIVGWSRILAELDAVVIDADGDPQIGTLVEVSLPDLPRRARFLRVQCGTGREFAVGVSPECKSAMDAQAWIAGMSLSQFLTPEVRT